MIVKSWLNFLNQYVFWSIMQNLLLSYISFAFLAAGISYIVVGAWIPKYCKISYFQGNKFVIVSFKKGFWEALLWIFFHFESIQCKLLIIVCLLIFNWRILHYTQSTENSPQDIVKRSSTLPADPQTLSDLKIKTKISINIITLYPK